MSSVPLAALAVQPQQPIDPLSQYARVLQIKSLLGQQALQPGQLQQQQANLQATQQENQQRALQIKSQQGISQALIDAKGDKNAFLGDPSNPQKPGLIADPKYGITPQDQLAVQQKYLEMSDAAAKMNKDSLEATQQAHTQITQHLNNVINAPPEDQPYQYGLEVNAIRRDPILSQYAKDVPPQFPGTDALTKIDNGMKLTSQLLEEAKSKATLSGEQAKSQQEVQQAAAPNPQQLADAVRTVGTYEGISPAERQGLIAELQHAPDLKTLQGIQARADAAQSSGQMKQASLAQARALMGNKFGESGLTANEKIWTDPQRGFAGALAQANQTKTSIVAGANGNGLLTNLVPTMEVLGINHAAGINRISPQEAEAARVPPEWATRWNAWADKAMQGKLSPELAKQGQQLMDVVIDSAHQRAIQSSQLIAKGHGIDPSQMPAMDRQGNLTTLDQAGKSNVGAGGTDVTDPRGVTHHFPDQKSADNFRKAAGIK